MEHVVLFAAMLLMADGPPKTASYAVPSMEACQKEVQKFNTHDFPGNIAGRAAGCIAQGEAQ